VTAPVSNAAPPAGRIRTLPTAESRASRIAYRITRTLVCGFTQAFTRMRIEGREHLPATGAYIVAPVHRSYVDTPISACISTRSTPASVGWFRRSARSRSTAATLIEKRSSAASVFSRTVSR
jgi:hypothetical protein